MKFNDARLIFGSRISDRIIRDNNGQLICNDCILSRTGYYDYLESEIIEDGDPNKIVKVYRTEKEVFDPRSIASFENKPLCDDHPDEDVTLANYKDLQKGFIKNVRRGTGKYADCLLCDIVVTDEETLEKIINKEKRELSAGYNARIIKDENGNYQMVDIRGNHLALVDSGRAGCATIRDSASRFIKNNGGTQMFGRKKTTTRLFDGDIVEVEEICDDEEEVVDPIEEPVQDDDAQQNDKLAELERRLAAVEAIVFANNDVADADEEVAEEQPLEEEPVEEVAEEQPVEEEVVDEEVQEENEYAEDDLEPDEVEDADDDVEELIDADAVEEEEEVVEEKPVKDAKAKNVKKSYAKFANSLKDNAIANKVNKTQQAFQELYNKQLKGE